MAIDGQIILIIAVYAILCGGFILLILYRTNRRNQLANYPIPHTPLGEDAGQAMREDIAASMERVSEIKVQPRFLSLDGAEEEDPSESISQNVKQRWIVVDSMRSLDRIVSEILPAWEKKRDQSAREFLFLLCRPSAPLGQVSDVCLSLLDSYERARYGDLPFTEGDRQVFIDTLMDLINRVSILDPEIVNRHYSEGPPDTAVDEECLIKWMSTPIQPAEYGTLTRSSSSPIHRRTSDLNLSQSRDLIDLSGSIVDEQQLERPASLSISSS